MNLRPLPFRPGIHAPPVPRNAWWILVRVFFIFLRPSAMEYLTKMTPTVRSWEFFHNMNHLVMTAVQSWNIFSRDYCLDQLACYQFCGFRRFWGTLGLQTVSSDFINLEMHWMNHHVLIKNGLKVELDIFKRSVYNLSHGCNHQKILFERLFKMIISNQF